MIPFNKPFLSGKELEYIADAVESRWISGNGKYTKLCHEFFKQKYGFSNCLLTSSCTDALEMCALLMNIQPGDEVIMPSYTFVSTANAFELRGAKIIFADSRKDHPGIDEHRLEELINPKTKAIVVVHYAGVACDMDPIMLLSEKYNLFVVEDAAQAIDSYYHPSDSTKKPLGSIGHFATFSFHETKNIISGEGGLLVINEGEFAERAEIIWEKGTNRSAFYRGEIDKYGWVDIGSSFLPSEITSAFLYAQLEKIETIQNRRKEIWQMYFNELNLLQKEELFSLPQIPSYATNNAHMFYMVLGERVNRDEFIQFMRTSQCAPVFHYISLHQSKYFNDKHDGRHLPLSDHYSNQLVRLPFFYELTVAEIQLICQSIRTFFHVG